MTVVSQIETRKGCLSMVNSAAHLQQATFKNNWTICTRFSLTALYINAMSDGVDKNFDYNLTDGLLMFSSSQHTT